MPNSTTPKAYTVRLDPADAEKLETAAAAAGRSVNQLLVDAVHAYLRTEFARPEFQRKLKAWVEEEFRKLERARASAAGPGSAEEA